MTIFVAYKRYFRNPTGTEYEKDRNYIRQGDMESPKISNMLQSDITFVNFEKRRYISENPINIQELVFLHKDGYRAIDTALADTIMRLNSMDGCRTRYCCSGHPGRFGEGYIVFEEIPKTLTEQIGKLKYWKHDASWEKGTSPDADQPPLIRWGMNGVPGTDATAWFKALLELAEMECLPQRNSFDEYRIESTYKERSPHKQEIRLIYPAKKPRSHYSEK